MGISGGTGTLPGDSTGSTGTGVVLSDVSAAIRVEEFTLGITEITNRAVVLSRDVDQPTETKIAVINGMSVFEFGTDFTASGTGVSWAGLGLEQSLELGDIIKVSYFTVNP